MRRSELCLVIARGKDGKGGTEKDPKDRILVRGTRARGSFHGPLQWGCQLVLFALSSTVCHTVLYRPLFPRSKGQHSGGGGLFERAADNLNGGYGCISELNKYSTRENLPSCAGNRGGTLCRDRPCTVHHLTRAMPQKPHVTLSAAASPATYGTATGRQVKAASKADGGKSP